MTQSSPSSAESRLAEALFGSYRLALRQEQLTVAQHLLDALEALALIEPRYQATLDAAYLAIADRSLPQPRMPSARHRGGREDSRRRAAARPC